MLHIAMIKVPVADIDRAAPFYTALLGLEPAVQAPEFGWAHYEAEALTLALYVPGKGGGDRAPGGSVDFNLAAVDLTVIRDRIEATGTSASIFDNDDGSVSLEVPDPDGNLLKIMGPAQPS